MKAVFALALAGCLCKEPPPPVEDVGDACRPSEIPDGGFDGTESLVRREAACDDACIVHHHAGDLEPDTVETADTIARDVFCTCSCGNLVCGDLDDVRCPECPAGFECCTLGAAAECGIAMVSDWCVREGTCP